MQFSVTIRVSDSNRSIVLRRISAARFWPFPGNLPRLIPSCMRLAEIYRETGNVDARIETLEKCVEYNSRYAEVYSLLSDVYYSGFQNAEKAAEILEKAEKLLTFGDLE